VQPSPAGSLEAVAHIIQLALTPVFLLSGIAALLNVFSTRLGRVADQVDAVSSRLDGASDGDEALYRRQLAYLRRRSRVLDGAVILGAIGGVATSSATLTLFLGAIRNSGAAWLLFGLFGLAVLCTIGALTCFCCEMLLASRGLRARAERGAPLSPPPARAGGPPRG
jgi:hypothetical protein